MKEVSGFTEQFDRCLMKEPAFCTAACPFGIDVRAFTEKVRQGRLTAAYKQYRDAVAFPGIVSRICDRPCEAVCPLGEIDRPIDLRGLEQLVCESVNDKTPDTYNLPSRGKSVCIIGAGLSGLACALKLAGKKYTVVVYEATDRIGGEENSEGFTFEIESQFQNVKYGLQAGRRIASRDEVSALGFDAVYVATGADGEGFGLRCASAASQNPLPCVIVPHTTGSAVSTEARGGLHDLAAEAGVCWIAGGALVGNRGADAIADGIFAAAAIDAFLRTGVLKTERPPRATNMVLAPIHLERYTAARDFGRENALPDGGNPSDVKEDAGGEAERCLGCQCDACMVFADLPAYLDKWPIRIRDEVFATTLPGKAEVKATPAKRLINMDNLSGVFKEVCPVHIDMDGLLLAGRQSMHRQEKMPWAFHEFWLRDMEHANGEAAALILDTRKAEAKSKPAPIAFFPGCQLGAASPSLIEAAWDELLALNAKKDVSLSGLILRCCGAPAEWAGDEELFAEAIGQVRADWEALGRPALVCACPSCMRVLGANLPEAEILSLYEILPPVTLPPAIPSSESLPGRSLPPVPLPPAMPSPEFLPGTSLPSHDSRSPRRGAWAVFDPCAASRLGNEEKSKTLKRSVRALALAQGLELQPLPVQEHVPRCCGFGGQPDCASPDFVRHVAEDRAAESALPYLCYCMNCREALMTAGKQSAHILELRYPERASEPPELSPSKRRENREHLRKELRRETPVTSVSGTPMSGIPTPEAPAIAFADGALARMDEDRILAQDVYAVIGHMRRTKENTLRKASNVRCGSLMIGRTTYWVEYAESDEGLTVTAAYAHRLAIERELVWAGTIRDKSVAESRQDRPSSAKADTGQDANPTIHSADPAPGRSAGAAADPLYPAPKDDALLCGLCGVGMKEMDAEFSYLGRSFRHKVMRCPDCGLVYIPETLARGRMREVEMALEDK